MPRPTKNPDTAADVGYEAQLWQMADALRGSMGAAEYKHVVLGLIFLKYTSDAFEERHSKLVAEQATGADPQDPDGCRTQNNFRVPPEARRTHLKAQASQSTVGQIAHGDTFHYDHHPDLEAEVIVACPVRERLRPASALGYESGRISA